MDLVEIFQVSKKFNMCFNPNKCAFIANTKNFLGFIMHRRRIDENPKKVRVILEMCLPY